MSLSFFLESPLDPAQLQSVLRDAARTIDYYAGRTGAGQFTGDTLVCSGWDGLPRGLDPVEIRVCPGGLQASVASEHTDELQQALQELVAPIAEIVRLPVWHYPRRVFGIGWMRTGTTSLIQALRQFGLFSWHCAPWAAGLPHFLSESTDITLTPLALDDYTAAADFPVFSHYEKLDQAYPDSLFILTRRPDEAWLRSATAHLDRLRRRFGTIGSIDRWCYGSDKPDRNRLLDRYRTHNANALRYFAGRDNLLELDVANADVWERLAGFLGFEEPNVKFPHLNRT